jgi:hypothetical protein
MGVGPELFDRPGLTVLEGEDRRGHRLASHYRVGAHAVVWIDPDLADRFDGVGCTDRTPSVEEIRAWMSAQGAEVLGRGVEHALPDGVALPHRPADVRTLAPADPATRALAAALLDGCSADDRDQADFDVDHLDGFLAGWVDGDRLLTLAGGRATDVRPGLTDIGVITDPDGRRHGRGRATVAAVVEDVLAAGEVPLYRCDPANTGSRRLCLGLGFEQVLWLEAFRWPA